MKTLAFVFGLCISAVGVVGVLVPSGLVWLAQHVGTSSAFYVLAAVRIAFGVMLISVAPASRVPNGLRVLGYVIVILGITTALTGLMAIGGARAAIGWWVQQGSGVLRLTGGAILALGGFVSYACAPDALSFLHPTLRRLRILAATTGNRATRAREAAECIRAARGYHWVGLYDVTPSHITAIAWTGPSAPAHASFPRAQGLNGAAVTSGLPIVVQDVRQDPRYLTTFGATRAEAIFPVVAGERGVVGTIDVESDHVNAFSAADERFLQLCAKALDGLWS